MRNTRQLLLIGLFLSTGAIAGTGQEGNARDTKPAYARDQINVPDAIAAVRRGDFFLLHIEIIANAHATEAIPDLEKQFAAQKKADVKESIASALVRLGIKEGLYWDYLVNSARQALRFAGPSSLCFQQEGKSTTEPPAELAAWAHEIGVSISDACERAIYLDPGAILMLVSTGDKRAIPLAREALKSKNVMIQVVGAKGLADLQDQDSIPAIIATVRSAPRDSAMAIAQSLIFFDDTEAQRVADEYLPKEMADALREERRKGATSLDH